MARQEKPSKKWILVPNTNEKKKFFFVVAAEQRIGFPNYIFINISSVLVSPYLMFDIYYS